MVRRMDVLDADSIMKVIKIMWNTDSNFTPGQAMATVAFVVKALDMIDDHKMKDEVIHSFTLYAHSMSRGRRIFTFTR